MVEMLEWICAIVEWLVTNAPVVGAVSSAVMVIVTGIMTWATMSVAQSNKRLLKNGETPLMVAVLKSLDEAMLTNVGCGPARDVRLRVEGDIDRDLVGEFPVEWFPQGHKVDLFINGIRSFDKPVVVEIDYKNLKGEPCDTQRCNLYFGKTIILGGESPLSDPLRNIQGSLEKLVDLLERRPNDQP